MARSTNTSPISPRTSDRFDQSSRLQEPAAVCRKHLQEFIDVAAGANRDPIGFYQAYPGLSVQDIHALIADSKPQSALAG
jgi:hypothetical protein